MSDRQSRSVPPPDLGGGNRKGSWREPDGQWCGKVEVKRYGQAHPLAIPGIQDTEAFAGTVWGTLYRVRAWEAGVARKSQPRDQVTLEEV